MTNAASAIANKPAWVDLGTSGSGGREPVLLEGLRLGRPGQPGPAVRRLRAGHARRQGRRGHRPDDVAGAADRLVGLHRHGRRRGTRQEGRGGRWARASRPPSTSASRAGWRSSRTRAARSSRPGSRPRWAASRPRAPNAFGWAELNARDVGGVAALLPRRVRLGLHASDGPGDAVHRVPGRRPEHRRRDGDEPDGAGRDAELLARLLRRRRRRRRRTATAVEAGGKEMLAPMDFPGGRMSMVADPQGAIFGLMRLDPR